MIKTFGERVDALTEEELSASVEMKEVQEYAASVGDEEADQDEEEDDEESEGESEGEAEASEEE